MTSSINLYESNNGAIVVRLELETLGFDFNDDTRSVDLKLLAENRGAESVILSGVGELGSVTAFGRSFMLPDVVTVQANSESTILDLNSLIIDNNAYISSTEYTVKLRYDVPSIGVFPAEIGGILTFSPCPSVPSFSLSCGRNIILGENVTVVSPQLDQGYRLRMEVYDGETRILREYLNSDDAVFFASQSWASDHTESSSFSLKLKVRPMLGSILLQPEAEMMVFCSLPAESSGPTAAVSTQILYDDDISFDFGVPIVNRSRIKIAVSDINCYQNASLSSIEVRFQGICITGSNNVTYPLSTLGEKTWSVTLTDSRGTKKIYSGKITVFDYGPPDFDAVVERVFDPDDGTEDIKFNIAPTREYSFSGANPYSYAYRFRNCADGAFSGWIMTQKSCDIRINADMEPNEMYELQLRATDSAGLSQTKSYTVKCDRVDLHIGRNRLGIGKKATLQNTVECAWDIKCEGDISFTMGDGNDVSLRSLLMGAAAVGDSGLSSMMCTLRIANTDEDISNIVDNILTLDENCAFYILGLCVDAEGLSPSEGMHFYIIYNDGVHSGYAEL